MSNKIVVGSQFGDEGKGLTVDYLCSITESPLVIRFSGGQQAGHTVDHQGIRHAFSNFGSGTLRGVPTYWSKFCTVDPIGIINEQSDLLESGINPTLYVDAQCPVTTLYDKIYNQENPNTITHGTCGVGVGATYQRESAHYSLVFQDLFYPSILKMKLSMIYEYYKTEARLIIPTIDSDTIKHFLKYIDHIISNTSIKMVNGIPKESKSLFTDYIFEGSQGLLLDQSFGFFPHVTRSNTGTKNAIKLLPTTELPEVFLVTRAYQTRHGNGPMTNESIPHVIIPDRLETNVSNCYQGKFRTCLLDLDLLQYGIYRDDYIRTHLDSKVTLVVTCLDHLERNEYRFTHQGKIIYSDCREIFVARIMKILGIKRVLINDRRESGSIREPWFQQPAC